MVSGVGMVGFEYIVLIRVVVVQVWCFHFFGFSSDTDALNLLCDFDVFEAGWLFALWCLLYAALIWICFAGVVLELVGLRSLGVLCCMCFGCCLI